jgi:hypothetical protein
LPPGVPLHAGTQNSSHLFYFGGVLDQNVRFSTFDLENDCQGQMFSRSKYQTRVEGEALKILRYHMHKSDVWFGLKVGRKENFMAYPPTYP